MELEHEHLSGSSQKDAQFESKKRAEDLRPFPPGPCLPTHGLQFTNPEMEELATGGIYSQTRERELLSQTGSRSGTNPLESEKWPNPLKLKEDQAQHWLRQGETLLQLAN